MNTVQDCCSQDSPQDHARRGWLKAGAVAGALMAAGLTAVTGSAQAASLSREQRDAMTPDQVLDMLREGNDRFRRGAMQSHDFLAQKRATTTGQFPAAVILSCIDSRAPAEIIFDTGIGDAFGARVAGNIVNEDMIGSMEFACAVAGAKLVLVMGHTRCGAIAGAIDEVKLGNLTGLLERIRPVVGLTRYEGERSGGNYEFVDAVALANVRHTVGVIRRQSALLAGLEQQSRIRMTGAMYDLSNGLVTFL